MVYSIAIDHDGNKWFGSEKGASRFDGSEWKTFTIVYKFWDLAVDDDNTVWATTSYGIKKYFNGKWQTYTTEIYSCITVDDNGVLWVGSDTSEFNQNHILRIEIQLKL